jgi:hypothetical protein
MTTAEWALLVSVVSLFVSIYSVVVASGAKDQAKKAATLTSRTEAIAHLRSALDDVIANTIARDTLDNIQRAMHLAELVFKQNIIDRIDGVISAASSLRAQPNDEGMTGLRELLERLIDDMNQEAALA